MNVNPAYMAYTNLGINEDEAPVEQTKKFWFYCLVMETVNLMILKMNLLIVFVVTLLHYVKQESK